MKAKKIVSFILAVAMLCSLCAVNVMADEQTLCQKVGIADDLSGNKVIKYDGTQNNDTPNLNTNYQVINLGDKLGVFSLSYYKITGKSLCAVLLGQTNLKFSAEETLTSNGYKLEYITPEGTNGDTASVVNGGVVRATKDSEVIDIPVVDSVDLQAGGIGAFNQGGTTMANVNGLGGKAFDVSAYQIKIAPGGKASTARARVASVDTKNTPTTIITAEFQVRITGDAILRAADRITLTYDGKLMKTAYGQSQAEFTVCNDASQWHNVAVEYNYADNRAYVYYDGLKLSGDAGLCSSVVSEIRFELPDGTYAQGGTAEIYNFQLYRGAYTGRGTSIASKALADNVGIDTAAKKIYYKADGLTKADLTVALEQITDASEVKLYADSTLAAVAPDTIVEGNVAVLRTASKTYFETYEIVKKADDELLIASANGEIKACPIYNRASGQIMIAEYTADGKELLGVKIGEDASSVSIADKASEGRIYKAFLWNDLTSAQPVLSSVLYPAE